MSKNAIKRVKKALLNAVTALTKQQRPDGHFRGLIETQYPCESDYIFMRFILQQELEASPYSDWKTLQRLADYIRSTQRESGGWGQYPGSKDEIDATVKNYFALKLVGDDPNAEHMQKARDVVIKLGGAESCYSFTKYFLACLGQVSWNAVPSIPPEIIYFPKWFYFNILNVSSWARDMLMPLTILSSQRPTRELPEHLNIDELFVNSKDRHRLSNTTQAPHIWKYFFLGCDRALKALHLIKLNPVRKNAEKKIERWVTERTAQTGDAYTTGYGGYILTVLYANIMYNVLNYENEHKMRQQCEQDLDQFMIKDERGYHMTPCWGPIWDTGYALAGLLDAECKKLKEPIAKGAEWLRFKECHFSGDWAEKLDKHVEASCWYFGDNNPYYPDVDDTAMVSMVLSRAGGEENIAASNRAVNWILAMQNDDGGWAAFDKTENKAILEYVPFADAKCIQDPSCPDITGRVLECLSWHGYQLNNEHVQSALTFLKSQQLEQGCFIGRWGVNYIYGTWQAIVGPTRIGVDRNEKWIQRAGEWLISIQKPDGSFGESPLSYTNEKAMGVGIATPTQTAWATMTMLAIFGPHDRHVQKAIDWLLKQQINSKTLNNKALNPDQDPIGSWAEASYTGTGFPGILYLNYHMYRLYFPTMALGRYYNALLNDK